MLKQASPILTKAHLDGAIATFRADLREFVKYFTDSQADQNGRLDKMDARFDAVDARLDSMDGKLEGMDAKVTAVLEAVATRKEMHNLVRGLKHRGVRLDDAQIFIS